MKNDAIFQSVKDTAKSTGLSKYYLRQNIKAGKIPCINSGNKVLINVPKLLAQLDQQSCDRE